MKKIVDRLIDCGFSFSYENKHSNGEIVYVPDIDLSITSYEGRLFWDYEELEEFKESDAVYDHFRAKIEQIMINETSSFD